MNNEDQNVKLFQYLLRHPEIKFPHAACRYVCDCVYRTLKEVGESRHVTAFEVLETFRKRSLKDFGPWTAEILAEWHISSPLHVGEIVFLLVNAGILAANNDDKLSDFDLPEAVLALPCPVLCDPGYAIRWEEEAID